MLRKSGYEDRLLGDERAVEKLIAVLEDENEKVRKAAADALRKLGDKRAVEKLIKVVIEDENHEVKRAAAIALKNIEATATAIPALEQALETRGISEANKLAIERALEYLRPSK